MAAVRVTAPAKINLSLRVRARRDDGFHEIATIFHAVSLLDEVTIASGAPGTGVGVRVSGDAVASVPLDATNIAARAAIALAARAGLGAVDVDIEIAKRIPVAGGMAGGSADAAAALLACRRLWQLDMPDGELADVAAGLGSDVPFGLVGGTALGRGRGELLTPVLTEGELHWVIGLSEGELSAGRVYAEWDRLEESGAVTIADEDADAELLAALRVGDARRIGPLLSNDLEPAALVLRPSLAHVIAAGRELGAVGALVSGSGPTCVFLAAGREDAIGLAAELAGTGLLRGVRHAVGPVPGARVIA